MTDVLLYSDAFAWALQGSARLTVSAQMALTAATRFE